MKRILTLIISFMLMTTSVFAMDYTNNDTLCAVGNITENSAMVLVTDDNADYFVIVFDGKKELLKPNEYHYVTKTFTGLEKDKEYEVYGISYKKGEKQNSNVCKFRTKSQEKLEDNKDRKLYINEYVVNGDSLEVTLGSINYVGYVNWYVNDKFISESFSTMVKFTNLKPNTEYTIKASGINTKDGIIKIKTTNGEKVGYTLKDGKYEIVK